MTSCLVLLLIQVAVTLCVCTFFCRHKHTSRCCTHTQAHARAHTHLTAEAESLMHHFHTCTQCNSCRCACRHTNSECFVSQGCSQAVKRVCILDTLLQLASLHMQHTHMHTVTISLSLIPAFSSLSLPWNSVHIIQMQQANLAPKASPTQSKLTYRQRQQDT